MNQSSHQEKKQHEKHRSHQSHDKKQKAKTFRRGKAVAFMDMMEQKRSTIKQQLDQPEYESIQQILIGELKAMDMVLNEFRQLFHLDEKDRTKNAMPLNQQKVNDRTN
ncbi:hypothetical protein J416_01114 [Gracilibacillus halophilus YIM-C55.5]|uniref:Uncharacterized protein n=1 Tax=Gracilibacillus halophilus YIM-C55.5 TaxID=1308866 RepID=N4WZ19_9BACI|nr:hypothetical protein [Gracilibacillus halophilus]ENH98296.1 hypothetical protein J416_01114 [Gracilibacillus halophilus YIM-C55.5]